MAKRYGELADQARRKSELNQVRYFNFDRDSKKAAEDIETAIKKSALLKRKYEVADAAGIVFTKSYKLNRCEENSGVQAFDSVEPADAETEATTGGESKEKDLFTMIHSLWWDRKKISLINWGRTSVSMARQSPPKIWR